MRQRHIYNEGENKPKINPRRITGDLPGFIDKRHNNTGRRPKQIGLSILRLMSIPVRDGDGVSKLI